MLVLCDFFLVEETHIAVWLTWSRFEDPVILVIAEESCLERFSVEAGLSTLGYGL